MDMNIEEVDESTIIIRVKVTEKDQPERLLTVLKDFMAMMILMANQKHAEYLTRVDFLKRLEEDVEQAEQIKQCNVRGTTGLAEKTGVRNVQKRNGNNGVRSSNQYSTKL